MQTVKVGNWTIELSVDADEHLSVWINHHDGSLVMPCDVDINLKETSWSERFTTEKIEDVV